MFNLVILPKGLFAPLILLAERSSRVWLISNQGFWMRLLPWPSFPFAYSPWPLNKHAFTPKHWCVSPGISEGAVQTLAWSWWFGGESFKGFACLTRVQLPERSTGFQYNVCAHVSGGQMTWLVQLPSMCVLNTYYVANIIEMLWPRAIQDLSSWHYILAKEESACPTVQ